MAETYKKIIDYAELSTLDPSAFLLVYQSNDTYSVGAGAMAAFVLDRSAKISDRTSAAEILGTDLVLIQHGNAEQKATGAQLLAYVQGNLQTDATPQSGSARPIQSGAVYTLAQSVAAATVAEVQEVLASVG